jgi:hypothetical protein
MLINRKFRRIKMEIDKFNDIIENIEKWKRNPDKHPKRWRNHFEIGLNGWMLTKY